MCGMVILLNILLFVFPTNLFCQQDKKISETIGKGNYLLLSRHFDETIEINLLGQEGIYSKIQAEQILRTFFENHKPVSFEIIHRGERGHSQYLIGLMNSRYERFRVYLLIRENIILQLRIEIENGN